MKHDLTVGQKIFLKPIGNNRNKEIEEVTILTIGKKYFTVDGHPRDRFFIDEMLHDGGNYSPRYKVYLYKQDIEDENEVKQLNQMLYPLFPLYGKSVLSLDTLRKINEIVKTELCANGTNG